MDGLKQRVVGALVIVSLAVIFLPMIFDDPHQATKKQIIPIPIEPEVPIIKIESPVKPSYKIVTPTEPQDSGVNNQTVDDVPDEVNADIAESNADSNVKSVNIENSQGENAVNSKSTGSASSSKPASNSGSVFNTEQLSNVWMVQLGTFGNHENALKLRDKLRAGGYDGHTTKINRDGSVLIRVFSGPYADKAKAEAIKKQLDKQFKVKSLVVHFE